MSEFVVGEVRLTRVPYFDVPLDAPIIGFTPQQVTSVPWSVPNWATADGQVIIGQAIWVIETDDAMVVVDPCGASDPFLRTGPEATNHEAAVVQAMEAAGFPIGSVSVVILSHLDGIGMVASVDGPEEWSPLFPNARIVVSEPELTYVSDHPDTSGGAALLSLNDQGFVDGIEPPYVIGSRVTMELTAGHSPGHTVIRIGEGAVFIGHLAVNPVQVHGGIMPDQHMDAVTAFAVLERELTWAGEREALVIGPLWPDPGAARVAGPPWVFSPAQPSCP